MRFLLFVAVVFPSFHCVSAQDPMMTPQSAAKVISPGGFPSLSIARNDASRLDEKEAGSSQWIATPMVTTCSSLAVVLGLFAALAWASRRWGGATKSGDLPPDLVTVLGTTAIDPQIHVTLLKVGGRIIVASRTGDGLRPLGEIIEPEEVARLTAACTGDAARDFQATIQTIEREPVSGFAGEVAPPAKRHLFATA